MLIFVCATVIYIYIYTHTLFSYIHVCIHVCMYVCMYVYIYIYIYICVWKFCGELRRSAENVHLPCTMTDACYVILRDVMLFEDIFSTPTLTYPGFVKQAMLKP